MTKYDELVEAYKEAHTRGQTYQARSYGMAHAIRAGIASFLGCVPERVEFRPVLQEADADTTRPTARWKSAKRTDIGILAW